MKRSACPSPAALERGFFTEDEAVELHAESCPECSEAWRQIAELSALARAVEVPPASSERRERLRTLLISNAQPSARRSRRWIPAASAAGIAVVVLGIFFSRSEEPLEPAIATQRGRIHAFAPSRYWWVHASPDEIVRLVEGSITVDVDPLRPDERFRIVTGNGEVEVRGTTFDVIVQEDRLQEVRVLSGKVDVRRDGRTVATLEAGERWRAEQEAEPEPVLELPKVPRATRVRRRASPETPALAPPEKQDAYEAGWSALRGDDFEAAARSFRVITETSTDAALREDAAYFLAVSLARGGRSEEAIEALELFLREHSSSPREDEAAAMLGWMYHERGDDPRAVVLFERASVGSSERAAKSARDGLEAIRRTRARAR